jgi:hypothetical protein
MRNFASQQFVRCRSIKASPIAPARKRAPGGAPAIQGVRYRGDQGVGAGCGVDEDADLPFVWAGPVGSEGIRTSMNEEARTCALDAGAQ